MEKGERDREKGGDGGRGIDMVRVTSHT